MPAVKMVPIKNEDGQVVAQYFEPSNSFAAAAIRNRVPMTRPDNKVVNVNRKLAAKGHYDDKGYVTVSPAAKTETLTVGKKENVK